MHRLPRYRNISKVHRICILHSLIFTFFLNNLHICIGHINFLSLSLSDTFDIQFESIGAIRGWFYHSVCRALAPPVTTTILESVALSVPGSNLIVELSAVCHNCRSLSPPTRRTREYRIFASGRSGWTRWPAYLELRSGVTPANGLVETKDRARLESRDRALFYRESSSDPTRIIHRCTLARLRARVLGPG